MAVSIDYGRFDRDAIAAIADSLIYDRTREDVDYALMLERESTCVPEDLKGAYNSSDRNRVGAAVNYIAALMRIIGAEPSKPRPCKDDWTANDIARSADNNAVIKNLANISRYLSASAITDIPQNLDNLTYRTANDIERILHDMYGEYARICGGIFCGDGCPSNFDSDMQIFDGGA